ncbi:ABC-type dipeptide/oligopeptide/nickel transport system, ATPase component [Nocardia amikacinitolerans]|uniref:dipeptide ABC transporter ATP-binding protein n=1 Tax=Nocardia amikacinitolerans TaxID=756689 RepID=UPI0020A3428A|nr:dipeptide ABC transporter ATP-binding protein [Nocardia amikacinitolerans]MCP2295865.1 ABC-type dipeptide/oligopeptide/nickel transport system, ATPase component [Nocardia amikacinitolerans]
MHDVAEGRRPALAIEALSVTFATDAGPVHAVADVSYEVFPGEVLAIVGESGSGKSVSSRTAMGLLPSTARVRGMVTLGTRQVTGMSERQLTALRGGAISMVFQEPGLALDPLFTVGFQIAEALRAHNDLSRKAAKERAVELLRLVGLPDPEHRVDYYPHQLSGGQKQRVVIAIAIACEPKVIIADEPTTALDVTVQAEILNLLRDLRDRIGSAIVLITHNMGVVADLADRVVVMREGRVVEQAPVEDLFARPKADYTRALLAAVPHLGARRVKSAEPQADTESHPAATATATDHAAPPETGTPALEADAAGKAAGAGTAADVGTAADAGAGDTSASGDARTAEGVGPAGPAGTAEPDAADAGDVLGVGGARTAAGAETARVTAAAETAGVRAAAETAGVRAAAETAEVRAAAETAGDMAAVETAGDTAAAETAGDMAAVETAGVTAAAETLGDMAAVETAGVTAAVETVGGIAAGTDVGTGTGAYGVRGASDAGGATRGVGGAPASDGTAEVGERVPVLEVCDLVVEFPGPFGRPRFRAVDGVSLSIAAGETVGLVGESGSGKSTIGRCVAALQRPTSGAVRVRGQDIANLSQRRLRPIRRRFGFVFQDPASSLNPRMTVGDCVAEPMIVHKVGKSEAIRAKVRSLLDDVRLPAGAERRYPHELSGGQRQRASLARALALDPDLLVADEPTSALDVSVQAAVLELFAQLQRECGWACLFISHDLAVVDQLADRIVVLRDGAVVEQGDRDAILRDPREEYTRRLVAAVPVPDPVEQRRRRAEAAALFAPEPKT